jgi:hypothetical protein
VPRSVRWVSATAKQWARNLGDGSWVRQLVPSSRRSRAVAGVICQTLTALPALPEHWQRFFALREELLVDYGYNTARAYWADLQDWSEWAVERDKDVLRLTEADVSQYCALLRRRKYAESTIRRRLILIKRIQQISNL